jgi:hypothetical protein
LGINIKFLFKRLSLVIVTIFFVACFKSEQENILDNIKEKDQQILTAEENLKDLISLPRLGSLEEEKKRLKEIRENEKDAKKYKKEKKVLIKKYNSIVEPSKIYRTKYETKHQISLLKMKVYDKTEEIEDLYWKREEAKFDLENIPKQKIKDKKFFDEDLKYYNNIISNNKLFLKQEIKNHKIRVEKRKKNRDENIANYKPMASWSYTVEQNTKHENKRYEERKSFFDRRLQNTKDDLIKTEKSTNRSIETLTTNYNNRVKELDDILIQSKKLIKEYKGLREKLIKDRKSLQSKIIELINTPYHKIDMTYNLNQTKSKFKYSSSDDNYKRRNFGDSYFDTPRFFRWR